MGLLRGKMPKQGEERALTLGQRQVSLVHSSSPKLHWMDEWFWLGLFGYYKERRLTHISLSE